MRKGERKGGNDMDGFPLHPINASSELSWYYETRKGLEVYVDAPSGVISTVIPWRLVANAYGRYLEFQQREKKKGKG